MLSQKGENNLLPALENVSYPAAPPPPRILRYALKKNKKKKLDHNFAGAVISLSPLLVLSLLLFVTRSFSSSTVSTELTGLGI